MEKKIQDIINQVLSNRGKTAIDELSANNDLRKDLGFDSLDLAELTVRIEAEFDVDIFENGLVSKVSEIFEIINSKK
jgi:acyl carrier protein